jgi:hypothetical protein
MLNSNITLESEELQAYARWTASAWLRSPSLLTEADHAVMALGLAGETSEVLEELEESAIKTSVTAGLSKELGDAVYYCARIAECFSVPITAPDAVFITASLDSERARSAYIRMAIHEGRVCEAIKKLIRDGVLPENQAAFKAKLQLGLTGYLQAWLEVLAAAGLTPQDVLRENKLKIEGRIARGTQQGSGNDR